MKTIQTIEKINKYPLLVFAVMVYELKNAIMEILSIPLNNIATHSFDWWDFSIKLFLAILVWLLLKTYFKLRREMNEKILTFSILSYVRNQRLFIKSFEGVQYFRSPEETEKDFWKRLPEGGMYKKYLTDEYEIVKKLIMKNMKKKTIEEIDLMLSEYYPDDIFTKPKEK